METFAMLTVAARPPQVASPILWAYAVFGLVLALGLASVWWRGEWTKAAGLERLILLGPMFYAAPLAAFGSEHLTITPSIAAMVPRFIPWHAFWTYFIGVCFIAAGASLATGIRTRLASALLALTFFGFVVLMDAPAWLHHPHNRFALALMLRELSFAAGPLALAASLGHRGQRRVGEGAVSFARYCVGVTLAIYAAELFLHPRHVPALPLAQATPSWMPLAAGWTLLTAAVFAVSAVFLLADRRPRVAAAWAGASIVLVELVVYVPFAIGNRATFAGFNFLGDTLMFAGTILLLAGALPRGAAKVPTTAMLAQIS